MRPRGRTPSGIGLARRLRELPNGKTLPDAEWERRHRWIVRLLWLHVAVLTGWGFARGYGTGHELLHVAALLPVVLLAASPQVPRRLRSACASVAAFVASALVVHLAEGVTEAHFHFFVLVVVLALYEDWLPFGLGVVFVALHHAVLGVLDPQAVYVRPDHFAHPVAWAAVHATYVLAAGMAAVLAWRFNERLRDQLGEAQERFGRAFGEAPVGMALIRPDGRVLQVNPALGRLLGYTEAELLAMDFRDLHHPEDLAETMRLRERLLTGEIATLQHDNRYLHRSGATVWASVSKSLVRDRDGKPLYLVSQVVDVTERRRAEERLRRQQADLETVAGLVRDIAVLRDARASVCEAARRLTGAGMAALVEPEGDVLRVTASSGGAVEDIEIPVGREPSGAATALGSGRPHFVADARNDPALSRRLVAAADADSLLFQPVKRGEACIAVLVVGWPGRVAGLESREAGLAALVAEEAALALEHGALLQRLEDLGRTDPLTDLPNRRAWDERVPHEVARCRRSGASLCVALIDVDDFKAINDREGHAAGDAFLVAAARAWGDRVRDTDLLARLGGDEFGLVLPDCAADEAVFLLERLRVALPATRSCSIGVAEMGDHEDLETLVRRADAALYAAKAAGRGQVRVADAEPLMELIGRAPGAVPGPRV